MGKPSRLKRWFFKGRYEKKEAEERRIEQLSYEYSSGNILVPGYQKGY